VRRTRLDNEYTVWWLLALVPAVAVAAYTLVGALWTPLLGGRVEFGCSRFRPVDLLQVVAWIGGAAATLYGAYRALLRNPRIVGVLVLSMGLALLADGLLLAYVLSVKDLPEVCRRD
jgi:hypothetical protein